MSLRSAGRRGRRRGVPPLAVLAALFLGVSAAGSAQTYLDSAAPVERRVEDLLSRMTPEEKSWQLFMLAGEFSGDETRFTDGLFGLQVIVDAEGEETAARMDAIQRHFVEDTRLGIPVVFFAEALHGLVQRGATVFPQAIGLAASFDTALMSDVARAVARECRSRGVRQVLSPVVNIASDPRWGRVEETYGEDPFLSSEMAVAFAAAFERNGVITTPKHWIANVGDGGRDSYPIDLDERLLREVHVPPFRASVERGGSRSIMAAHNSVNGSPCSANRRLNDELLKKEMGFAGFIISDAGGVGGIPDLHLTATDYPEAAEKAIESGLDVIFQTSYDHYRLFSPALLDGRTEGGRIDDAVARVLKAKFELGLFEDPYVEPGAFPEPGGPDQRTLARKAADESIVLLKNDGAVLPFPSELGSVAVIGPDAAEARLGGYSAPPTRSCSILQGIAERVASGTEVRHAVGCARTPPAPATAPSGWSEDAGIEEAVRLAARCDAAVVAVGIEEGEFRDRSSLALPGRQEELIARIAALGKPLAVVLVGGSAVTMSNWVDRVPAVLVVWYPGEEGGRAVAGVLFGGVNPAGRLPISFPVSEGQLPFVYYHKPSGRGDDYLDLTGQPQFPFGHGLSYTSFEYSDLRIEPAAIGAGESSVARFTLTNTGLRAGDEVVQLYVHDEVASVARPIMSLAGFERVHLRPGESREISFAIAPQALTMLDRDLHEVIEPGTFGIMIGASSRDIRLRGVLSVAE